MPSGFPPVHQGLVGCTRGVSPPREHPHRHKASQWEKPSTRCGNLVASYERGDMVPAQIATEPVPSMRHLRVRKQEFWRKCLPLQKQRVACVINQGCFALMVWKLFFHRRYSSLYAEEPINLLYVST
jgi:hypothetical protein